MSEAIDWLREEWPYDTVEPTDFHVVSIGVTQRDLIRAIDEYDAAAATAGRLIAEVAELRNLVADTAAACAVWRRRAEAAEAAVRVYQYAACGVSMTEAARDAQFPDLTEEP